MSYDPAGEDYAAISPPLMIELTPESLEEPIEVEITILNDSDLEQMIETFTVFLETSDPAVSLTTSNATVLIVEDDGTYVLVICPSFSTSNIERSTERL